MTDFTSICLVNVLEMVCFCLVVGCSTVVGDRSVDSFVDTLDRYILYVGIIMHCQLQSA